MGNNTLKDKKILFISPKFFGYHEIIQSQLHEFGAQVDYFDERPSNNTIIKAVMRINRNFVSKYIHRYYENLLSEIEAEKYDYLFVIKGEVIPEIFINKFKKLNPDAQCLLMLWDSIKNYEYVLNKSKLFDVTFSFDKDDCNKYGFEFRPLFYNEKYLSIANKQKELPYDITFIGTVHSDRLKILEELKRKLGDKYTYNYYLYIPSKVLFYIKKVFQKEFRIKSKNYFQFESLSSNQVLDIISKSRVVIDIEHPGQTGLTMRTIEMLGAGRKIITTNQSIKDYDFYCEDNICIINREDITMNLDFLESDFKVIDKEILDYYSINGFLSQIFKA